MALNRLFGSRELPALQVALAGEVSGNGVTSCGSFERAAFPLLTADESRQPIPIAHAPSGASRNADRHIDMMETPEAATASIKLESDR